VVKVSVANKTKYFVMENSSSFDASIARWIF
jgi:hypothetical protein